MLSVSNLDYLIILISLSINNQLISSKFSFWILQHVFLLFESSNSGQKDTYIYFIRQTYVKNFIDFITKSNRNWKLNQQFSNISASFAISNNFLSFSPSLSLFSPPLSLYCCTFANVKAKQNLFKLKFKCKPNRKHVAF